MERKNSRNTPLYHEVPKGWTMEELVARHHGMGGTYPIAPAEPVTNRDADWKPEWTVWGNYRKTLDGIAKGIKAGDPICVELAIMYIQLNYFGSGTGYIRARFARLLKPQNLSKNQILRLKRHFESLIQAKQCFNEFHEYNRLRNRIAAFEKN